MSRSFLRLIKNLAAVFLFLFLSLSAGAQDGQPKYSKALADSLGSDEYGMKRYVLVILKTGAANITDKKVVDSLFRGHMENISRLVASGKLVVAGPLQKNDKSYRGIFILNVAATADALPLLKGDPAIQSGLLDTELYGWYGSAALPMYLEFHDKVQKKKH